MSLVNSQTTYYVDINSEYRNLEKYQNPADFAVTFQSFTGTGMYPEGVPLDPISPSSFFTPISIDPDFDNADLEVFGATVYDIIRTNKNITYICGILQPEGIFGIQYKGQILARSDPGLILDDSTKFGFVVRVNSLFTNSILSGYEVPWINYYIAYPESSIQQYMKDISIREDASGNIFVNGNCNYGEAVVLTQFVNSTLLSPFQPLKLKIKPSPSLPTGSFYNITYYLTPDGGLADFAGHDWGLHIVYDQYSLSSTNNTYGKSTFQIDPSSNLLMSNNIDTYKPIYNQADITIADITSRDTAYFSRKSTSPYNNYVYNSQFISCAYTFESDPFSSTLGGFPITGCAFNYTTTDPTNFIQIASDNVAYTIDPSLDNGQYWTSVCFQECNGDLFAIAGYMNAYLNEYETLCPFTVMKLDTVLHTHTTVATSPNLNLAVLPGCITNGTDIYIACKYQTGAIDQVQIYSFDATTNALGLSAALNVVTSSEAYGSYFLGQNIGGEFIFFEFPSTYIAETWNKPVPSLNPFTCRVYKYIPFPASLTQINTISIYQDFRNATFQTIGTDLYMYVNYYNTLSVELYNVTNPYAITNSLVTDSKPTQTSNVIPFTISYGSTTHSCVLLTFGYKVYIMDNPLSPQDLFNDESSLDQVVPQLFYNGYFYACSNIFQSYYQLLNTFTPAQVTSQHFNQNSQTVLATGPANSVAMGHFSTSSGAFVLTSNSTDVAIYKVSNINLSGLVYTITLGTPFVAVPKHIYCCIVEDTLWVFFTCADMLEIYKSPIDVFDLQYYNTISVPGIIVDGIQVSGYVKDGIQFICYLTTVNDPSPAFMFKFAIIGGNLLFITQDYVYISLGGYIATAFAPLYFPTTNQQMLAVFLRLPFTSINNGTKAFLVMMDVTAVTQLQFYNIYGPDDSYPSYPQSLSVNYINNVDGFRAVLTAYNSPQSDSYARYYTISMSTPDFDDFTNGFLVGYDAYTFEPNRQRCAITTYPYLDGFYSFRAGGFTGSSDSYLQTAVSNIPTNFNFSLTNVKLNGNYVNEMYASSYGSKVTCVMLLSSGILYLYDVSNPQFASLYQDQSIVQRTYDLPPSFNSSFIHRVLQDGTPNWLTAFGTSFDAPLLGQQITNTSLTLDLQTNTVSTIGTWNSCFQVFEETSTGSYVAINKLSNNNPYRINGFRVATDILTGQTKYIIPYIGQQDVIPTSHVFNTYTYQYLITAIATNNFNILSRQIPGEFINPNNIQSTLYAISSSSSFVMSESRFGLTNWASSLFTEDSQKNVYLQSITFDDARISVVGSSNCNTLQVIDSTGLEKQKLYIQAPAGTLSITSAIVYTFSSTGVYFSSQSFELDQLTSDIWAYKIHLVPQLNQMLITPNWNAGIPGYVDYHNKDGTVGGSETLPYTALTGTFVYSPIVQYKYNSYYVDADKFKYSIAVYDQNPPYGWTGGAFDNYSFGIYNPYNYPVLNRNFNVRTNVTVDTIDALVLNQLIDTSTLDRRFVEVNGVTGTDKHWVGSLSKSPLYNMITYVFGPGPNQITVTLLNPAVSLEQLQSGTFYLTYPRDDGAGGYYLMVIEILAVADTGTTGQFIFTIADIADLQSPEGGPYYGPYLFLNSFNESLYWNLQFYPGSIKFPTYFNVQIVSLIIPNRPVLNLRNYGGRRGLSSMPYIYVQIYNEDENGNYDSSILNVAYDNATSPLGIKPAAQFKIPMPTIIDPTANFVVVSSDNLPLVKFSPGFYNIRLRLLDFNGKVLQFDASATKPDDATFTDGIVPEYLTNVYYRLSFKKAG